MPAGEESRSAGVAAEAVEAKPSLGQIRPSGRPRRSRVRQQEPRRYDQVPAALPRRQRSRRTRGGPLVQIGRSSSEKSPHTRRAPLWLGRMQVGAAWTERSTDARMPGRPRTPISRHLRRYITTAPAEG